MHVFLAPDDDSDTQHFVASPQLTENAHSVKISEPDKDQNEDETQPSAVRSDIRQSETEPSLSNVDVMAQNHGEQSELPSSSQKLSDDSKPVADDAVLTNPSGPNVDGITLGSPKVVIDPRIIDLLESRVYALVDELLEVEGMGIIKKNIVTLLCKSIGIFFNGTFIKWMQHQAQPETAASQISSLVAMIRTMFWPNDLLIEFGTAEQDEAILADTDRKLRTECISTLNTVLPTIIQVMFFFGLDMFTKSVAHVVCAIGSSNR